MQGNKKHADGQSDSSSIGSLLDDTDKEVCSLTDRAFKSLCVAELETAYAECDPIVSPHFSYQFSTKLFRGPRNHALKKTSVSIKPFSKSEEHSTFQQLPKNIQEDKKALTNSTPNVRRKLGLPMLGLKNYKHTSKVSSLIKTFDNVENQESPVIAKQPVINILPKCEVIHRDDKAFVGDKTSLLNIQKKFYEFSDMCQVIGSASVSPDMHKRHNKMDLVCRIPCTFYPAQTDNTNRPKIGVSKKTAKNRTGKEKEPVRRGNFLHSENSAFESWNAHHKKLSGIGRDTEIILKEEKLTYSEEAPFYKQSSSKVTGPIILEGNFSSDALPLQPQASLSPISLSQSPLPVAKSTIIQTFPEVCGPLAPVYRISTSPCTTSNAPFPSTLPPQVVILPIADSEVPIPLPSASHIPVPPEAATQGIDTQPFLPQVTLFPEKSDNSELKPPLEKICPPWRRQKTIAGKMLTQTIATEVLKMNDSLHENPANVITLSTEVATVNSHPAPSDATNPFFNITELLTPVILPKQETELADSQILLVMPPLSGAGAAKETEERILLCSQNNYKSKAPSLLFNLKDIRKRVKSTYSPSPLLRALEDKKKIKEQENIKSSAAAAGLLEESSKLSAENDEFCSKRCERPGSPQGKNGATIYNGHFSSNYQIVSSPNAKTDILSYQSRSSLRQDNSEDVNDWKITNLHTNEPSSRRHPLPSKSSLVHTTREQEAYMQNIHLWNNVPNRNADLGSQVSPNLVFIAEDNMNDNRNQGCPINVNEHKNKRSASSSEQSFASVTDQPLHEEPICLMHLFQKACLQESQRTKEEMSEEEKVSSKGIEKAGRQEEGDFSLSNCTSNMDGMHAGKDGQSENENVLEERETRAKGEEKGKCRDSASEGKSEEPLTPTSTSSFKPHLFTIKDNTFKSSPVIKAIKLPLLRSLSCEDAIGARHVESEKQAYGPIRTISNIHETDWPLSRNKIRQKARKVATDREADDTGIVSVNVGSQMAEKSNPIAESALRKELRSSYMREPVEDDDLNTAPMFLHKDRKSSEKPHTKGKGRAGKLRSNSASQPNLSSEGNTAQSKQRSPTREKINYFKNHLLSRQRGGSCMKKIITQGTRSPIVSENRSHSPAVNDTFGNTLGLDNTSAALGYLVSFTTPSPRSESTVQSSFKSPFSDTFADCNITKPEKTANASSLHRGNESEDNLSAMETFVPTQMNHQLTEETNSPVAHERLQLMGQMMKTAAKPPAVPPKTEKTLRRAKKLASRRKKSETQKKLQVESLPDSGPAGQCPASPVHVSLPLTPSESNLVSLQPNLSLSPTHSLPATQRKLLQDPDSGEYFIVDLPIQLKTFYDPESGRYIQLSVPPSKRDLSQTPSSKSLPPSYILYPNALPLRVSSVPIQTSPSQLSEPPLFMQAAFSESASDWQQDDQYQEPLDSQSYVEAAVFDVHDQENDASKYNFEKDMSLSANADIISMGAIEDFAVEGIS